MGSVNLGEIRSDRFCVLDTNILIYAEQRASFQAQRLTRVTLFITAIRGMR